MANELHLLCAGAVKGLVLALQPGFEASEAVRIVARFGAVGAMRDELAAGAPCDVFVATEAMIAALVAGSALRARSEAAIGRVETAIAVREGVPPPDITSEAALRSALLAASALYLPDATRSTAGAHVIAVLEALGIREPMASRLREHPDGATAMRELAASGDDGAIGCTQETEIRYTPGLALVGALGPPHALATVYVAAVATSAREPDPAARFVALLAGPVSAERRRAGGLGAI
ncbi:MAG: substrate-binding domain-containing protein [Rhizobacter sp.]|nr:substrate-binding domain-containing protein [Rhizobacter sp.]